MIRLLIILVFLQGCVSTPIIVEEPKEQPIEDKRKVPDSAVNVEEVMALKEVLEKVVDLQKKEGEE